MAAASIGTLQFGFKGLKRSIIDANRFRNKVERAATRPLFRAGGLVRKIARRSIKPGGKKNLSSRPGSPPRSHTGLLRRGVAFAVDRGARTVTIGPLKLGAKGKNVPNVLEFGGVVRGVRRGRNRQPPRRQKPRPFMAPALKKAEPQIENLFKNTLV